MSLLIITYATIGVLVAVLLIGIGEAKTKTADNEFDRFILAVVVTLVSVSIWPLLLTALLVMMGAQEIAKHLSE